MTILTINCQSLQIHVSDLQDSISRKITYYFQKHGFLKWNTFNYIITIYQNKNITRITTLNIELTQRNARELNVTHSAIGDICAWHVKMVMRNNSLWLLSTFHQITENKIFTPSVILNSAKIQGYWEII